MSDRFVHFVLAGLLVALVVIGPAQGSRLADDLDVDFAGFVLQNPQQLALEIRQGQGPRLASLLTALDLEDSPAARRCLQAVADVNGAEGFALFRALDALRERPQLRNDCLGTNDD